MLKVFKDYGVVSVLGLGLIGAFFFWAVNVQVAAQTAELQTEVKIIGVNFKVIQDRIAELNEGQRQNTEAVRELAAQQQADSLKLDVIVKWINRQK